MATLAVNLQFTSNGEGFTTSASSGSTSVWAYNSTGGNTGGRLVGTGPSTDIPGDVGNAIKTATFQALGVPSGAVITGISAGSFDTRCNQYPGAMPQIYIGPMVLTSSVGSITMVPEQTLTTTSNWFTASGTGSASGLTLASSSSLDIKIAYDFTRGPTNTPEAIVSLDNVQFTITYTLPDITGSLSATETGADVAAIAGYAGDITGSMAATEAATKDTAAGTGAVVVSGAVAAVEAGSDTANILGQTAQFVTVLFPFDASAEGFVDSLASGRWSWSSSSGNPGGRMTGVTSGAGSFIGSLVHAGTYESYGIPIGATITGFRLGKFDSIANAYPGPTAALKIGPLQIGAQTLVPQVVYSGTSSWATHSQSGVITGLSIPSSTEADLKVGFEIVRNTGIGGQPQESLDNVSVQIDYIPAGPIIGSLAATEVSTDVASITGAVGNMGTMFTQESGADTFSAAGVTITTVTMALVEAGSDTLASTGSVMVAGSLAVTEDTQDTFLGAGGAEGTRFVSMAAQETGSDILVASIASSFVGSMAAQETGSDYFTALLTFVTSDQTFSLGGFGEIKPWLFESNN